MAVTPVEIQYVCPGSRSLSLVSDILFLPHVTRVIPESPRQQHAYFHPDKRPIHIHYITYRNNRFPCTYPCEKECKWIFNTIFNKDTPIRQEQQTEVCFCCCCWYALSKYAVNLSIHCSNYSPFFLYPPLVSKLKVHKSNQSLQFLEDSRVRVNCSVTSQTSPDSQHAVLWYARKTEAGEPDELLLKIKHSGAFEYGAYAEEERLRSRVQSETLSPRLYGLTLHRAETSDSGTYYCLVEEWLTDPDGTWYRLAQDFSGFTHVVVRQPGKKGGCLWNWCTLT